MAVDNKADDIRAAVTGPVKFDQVGSNVPATATAPLIIKHHNNYHTSSASAPIFLANNNNNHQHHNNGF